MVSGGRFGLDFKMTASVKKTTPCAFVPNSFICLINKKIYFFLLMFVSTLFNEHMGG